MISTSKLMVLVLLVATPPGCDKNEGGADTPGAAAVLPGPLNVPLPAAPPEVGNGQSDGTDSGVAPTEPAAAPPEPEPALAEFPAPLHDVPGDLVPAPLDKYFTARLIEINAKTWTAIWGKASHELPFLAAESPEEVEDTRPWQSLYDHATPVGRGKHKATWGFLDGELFMVRLDYRDRGKKLVETVQVALAAPPTDTRVLRDRTVLRLWYDNGLVVGVEELKGKFALVLADRGRFERHERRLQVVDEAERLVWGSLDMFYDRRAMNVRAALDNNLRAAELVPDFGDAWSNACHAAYQLGQLDDADAHCNKALEVTKEQSVRGEASYYLGLVATTHGNREAALRLLRVALSDVPRAWSITSDIRLRLAGLESKVTESVLERAVYDYFCAGHRDGDRQRLIPGEFGFADWEALRIAADDELVDIEGSKTNAEQRCSRR